MRLGVFYTVARNPWGGTYTIKHDIFRGLAAVAHESGHELVVFTDDESARTRFPTHGVSWVKVPALRARALLAFARARINRVFAHGLLVPPPFAAESFLDPFLFGAGVDLFINLGPDALSMAVPYVCAVFDLQHRNQPFMPEVNTRGYWERWDEQYREYLGRATFVVNGTAAGQREVERFYQVPRERLIKSPLPTPAFAMAAAKEPKQPRPAYVGQGPFVFYPAQFWPHKNHVSLLEAVALVRQQRGLDLHAVFVGSDQGNQAFVEERIAAMGLSGVAHVRGFVDRPELIALYQHAVAMPCVSTCGPESLPTLEAFALGCPVITSDTPGTREQFEGAALFVSVVDPDDIAGAIATVHQDAARREAVTAAGRAIAAERTAERFARGIFEAVKPFAQKRKNWSAREPYTRPLRIGRVFGG